MNQVSLGIAFMAGILSFLSPCVPPLVPGYISFLSGVSLEDLRQGAGQGRLIRKAGLTSIFFVLGFSVVFIALGASATLIGRLLVNYIGILTKVAGVLIVILGLHLLGVFKLSALNYQKGINISKFKPGYFGAFLIGLAFAFGWTPCVGPILASILALAAAEETMIKGMVLLSAYSLGLGLPFIMTGFAVGSFMRFFEKYRRFIRWGEIVAGVFLVVIGVLIFFDSLGALSRFLPEFFYGFSK